MSISATYRHLRDSIQKKPFAVSLVVFIVLLMLTAAVTWRMYLFAIAQEREKAITIGDAARDQLELTLHYGLSATQTVALMIENESLPDSFEVVAEKIMRAYPVLDAVELAPGGIVSHVYPYEANRAAIGFNILGDSIQRAEASEAIKQKRLIFAGPLNLVQGGIGVVGRLPVYSAQNGTGRFWGFSLVVIKLNQLLTQAKFGEIYSKGYDYQLLRINSSTAVIDTFVNKHHSLPDPVILSVTVPNGHWDLLVAPVDGWRAGSTLLVYPISGSLISCLIALFVWYVGKQPEKLTRLVEQRTKELRQSETKFRTYVENAPNIITIIDFAGTITYLNKTEAGYALSDFIGKNIFQISHPRHHQDIRRALDNTLQTHTTSFYFTSGLFGGSTLWYENRVALLNPDNPGGGLLITSINITERKAMEDSLVERQLHSQSLLRLSKDLERSESYGDVFTAAKREVEQTIGYHNIWLYILSDDKLSFQALVSVGEKAETMLHDQQLVTLSIGNDRMLQEIANATEIVVVEDAQTDERTNKEIVARMENRTIVNVPIILMDRNLGTIGCGTFGGEGVRVPTVSEREYLKSMASHIAVAVDRIHIQVKRKEVEDALRNSEQYNRSLIDTSPNATSVFDLSGRLVYANKQALRIFGYTSTEDIAGKHFVEWVPEGNQQFVPSLMEEIKRGTVLHNYRTELKKVDGSVFIGEVNASVVPDQDGNPAYFLIISSDITERVNVEREMLTNRRRLERAEEVALFGNWELSLTEKIMRASDGAKKIYGLFAKEVPFDDIRTIPLPEYRPVLDKALANLIHHGIPYEVEFKIKRRSDEKILDIYSKAEFEKGSGTVFGIIQDITKRKETEERLRNSEERNRALISSLPDLLFVLDAEGRFLDYHAPENTPLWLPPERFVGKTIFEVLPAPLLETVKPKFDVALQSGLMQSYHYSSTIDGTLKFYEARLITFGQNKVLNIVRDVTDKIRAENELKTLNEELEARVLQRTAQLTEANREMEAFSYSVSHDLRAPLRAIDSFSAMLMEGYSDKVDEEGKRLISVVRSSIKKMDLLINGLLTLSRIGRSEIHYATISMMSLVHQVVADLATDEIQNRYAIVVHSLPDVSADEVLLKQVWNNLISNAIKYASVAEKPAIEIRGWVESGSVFYSIKDNGIGFDPSNVNKLFGIFQRLHSDDQFKGLGIGLSIVQRIVHRHGGKVWAEGKVNAGATFFFSLPNNLKITDYDPQRPPREN